MQLFIFILTVITCVIGVMYFALILAYSYGWNNTPSFDIISKTPVSVSIIVPARNEERNIVLCLNALLSQSYPFDKFEIIVVDDASEDKTNALVKRFEERNDNLKLITIPSNAQVQGKKNALAKAIASSTSELIVTTDADCIMGEYWLSTIVNCYQQSDAKMIVSPVAFHHEKSILEKMQSLELMALIGSGGGSLFYNKAILCNGANLAYSREVFNEVEGFHGIDHIDTGDDVLLMYKIQERYKEGVVFLKDEKANVYTNAKKTIKGFVNQRVRWASKDFSLINRTTQFVSIIVYLFSFFLLLLTVSSLFYPKQLIFGIYMSNVCIILWFLKYVIDFVLLFLTTSYFKKRRLLVYFPFQQIIYVMYIVFIGSIASIMKYQWKGRQSN